MNKILIVEDDSDIRNNLELLLNSEGYETISAENGLNGLNILSNITPDLIISDIMMPYVDGFELFQKVRENDRTKIIPFIFLTAKSDSNSIRSGMSIGADDYITKPFISDDLLTAVKIRLEKYNSYNKLLENIYGNISKYVPHELRTPLVAIMGYSELILSKENSPSENEIMDMVDRIHYAAKRLHSRIEKFIQFSETDQLRMEIENNLKYYTLVDESLINEVILSNYLTKERKTDFDIIVEPILIKIQDIYLYLLLNELLENSVKFSKVGTKIIIKGKHEGLKYNLQVKDFGEGMTEEDLCHIGVYNQPNRDVRQQEGNGLGLAIVKNILKAFNGEINITSKIQNYTDVSIVFLTHTE